MIPAMILDAAAEHGWLLGTIRQKRRLLWISMGRGEITIYVWRDRWRHSYARAYRGHALAAILPTQRDIVEYMATP